MKAINYAPWVQIRLDVELRKCLVEALTQSKGRICKAAALVGCSYNTFRNECRRLDIVEWHFRL